MVCLCMFFFFHISFIFLFKWKTYTQGVVPIKVTLQNLFHGSQTLIGSSQAHLLTFFGNNMLFVGNPDKMVSSFEIPTD